jgi:hypothetical protein
MVAAQATPAVNSTTKATEANNKTVLSSPLFGGAERKVKTLAPLGSGCSIRRRRGCAIPDVGSGPPGFLPERLPPSEEKDRRGILEGNHEAAAGVPVPRKPVRTSSSGILISLGSSG